MGWGGVGLAAAVTAEMRSLFDAATHPLIVADGKSATMARGGFLEVRLDYESAPWGTVCNDGFNQIDAIGE